MNNHLSDTAWFVWYFSQANCCFFYNPALAQKDPKTGKVNSRVEGCSGWDPDDPITEELARRHLEEGSVGAGTPTTDGKFAVKFAALDYDSWDISPPELAKRIKDRGLRGVVCRTRSGRGRVFLPFVEPVEVETAYKMMEILRDLLDLPKDPHITEIFPGLPKKGQAPEAFIKGSNLWLPYRKGSAECAIDPETGEDVPFSTFRQMWGKWLTTKHMVESWVKEYVQATDQSGEFDEGDDANARVAKLLKTRCETLANKKDGGHRNEYLYVNSRVFFGYAASGYVSDEDVEKAFTDAAIACGLDFGLVRDLLRRTKKSGHAAPLKYKVKKERKRKGRDNVDDEGIKIVGGELPRVMDEAEQALLASGFSIYQRAGRLIRPIVMEVRGFENVKTNSWCLTDVKIGNLIKAFTSATSFWNFDMRSASWHRVDCPKKIVEYYMDCAGEWKVPTLLSVVNVPVLMLNGTLIDKPGLHVESGILYEPEGADFGQIPDNPTKKEAEQGLQQLLDLISTFTFMSKLDRSVAIAMFMTAVLRPALPTSPMFGITAYEAGSGKTKLAEMAGCIANGRVTSATNISRDEQEFEKGLKSALISGRTIIGFDNLDRPLESGLLCTALSARGNFEVRGFGVLKDITCLNTATIIATGNNLEIRGDLIRRTVMCALDPGCAHPEQREFDNDPVQDALAKRIDLVRAILTIARAYQQTERVKGVIPLGNFEEWSRMVREALIWLGMDDPCKTGERIEKSDKDVNNLREVIERWPERDIIISDPNRDERPGTVIMRTKEFSTRELINWCRPTYRSGSFSQQPLFETLLNVAPSKKDGEIDSHHLGNWFRKRRGKFVGRDRLMLGETKDKKTNVGRWVIERHLSEDEYEKILLASLNGKGSNGHAVNGNDVKQQVTLPGIIDHEPHEDDEERIIM